MGWQGLWQPHTVTLVEWRVLPFAASPLRDQRLRLSRSCCRMDRQRLEWHSLEAMRELLRLSWIRRLRLPLAQRQFFWMLAKANKQLLRH